MQWPAGIAYIICPKDVDRAQYIGDCYRNNRVSMRTEDGAIYHRVIIPDNVLNDIEFPLDTDSLGSAVGFVVETQQQNPMIFAKFPKTDEMGGNKENAFQVQRKFNDKLIAITGSVEDGSYTIAVDGGQDKGMIKILIDGDEDGEFNIEVAGKVAINTTDSTELLNHTKFESVVADIESGDQKKSIIKQESERTLIGNAQVILNGDSLQMVHYKGYSVSITDSGIEIDALDKEVVVKAGDSEIEVSQDGVSIQANKISLNGSFEALYNTIPGMPIADVSQIGVSSNVTLG